MHETRTALHALAGVIACAAASGCVAVETGPVPPPARQAPPSAQAVTPQIVQGPGREVLRRPPGDPPAGNPPAGDPASDGAASPRTSKAAAPGSADAAPRSRRHPAGAAQPPVRQQPRPTPEAAPRPRPGTATPSWRPAPASPSLAGPADTALPVPAVRPDVCALGEEYGGWPTDSPQAVICKQAAGD
ncbi:hypothetical protein QCN29_15365 [Streptomyces sp. HNM0663]|uniref:Lipoprotein n=1 Tax=Streptomyces chengmaiensis TaxID=3040919 RepID=A0ABT6HQ24_9ACTN|nr:hypothetical protein [Streptomyces chengmaiensis]MDH2390144.1 hypothetical protein [Streptomyces chengmaiensis]